MTAHDFLQLDVFAAAPGRGNPLGVVFARVQARTGPGGLSAAEGEPCALVVRAFAPADGVPEDPVTGSANAAIAAWLHANHALPAARFRSSQGREVSRDGLVEIEVDVQDEVWVGGQTQTVIEGTLRW